MNPKLKRLIDDSKYISFDIFDTAILRNVREPVDLFDLVERQYNSISNKKKLTFTFKKERINAEKYARDKAWKNKRSTEVTLHEIYECLQSNLRIDNTIINLLKAIEIDSEIKICTKNEYIFSVYRYCIEKGKNVLFTSDMYLPLSLIKNILMKNGYDRYEKIFLSSDIGVTKSTGELFRFLIKDIGCKPEEIVHIGDNYKSDVESAKKFGLKTFYYEKCNNLYLKSRDHLNIQLITDLSVEESVYHGIIRNRFFSNRDSEISNHKCNFWYYFGYKNVGILYLAYISWLIKQVNKDGIDKVFFLSRDGFIMKKVYDLVSSNTKIAPPSEYIYASRRAINVPSISELDNRTLDFLVSGTSMLKVSQFLQRIGLDPRKYNKEIKKAGFKSADDLVITGKDYANLRELFRTIFDDIKRQAEEERSYLIKYFCQVGFFNTKKAALVDIGWHGSLQKSICKLIEQLGYKINVKGYYLGTFEKALDLSKEGMDIYGYLCNFGEPKSYHNIIKLCVEIFEFIHTAPHGSVIRFEEVNGVIEPIFDQEDCTSDKNRKAAELQKGALDFIKDYLSIQKNFVFLEIPRELAIRPLYRVLKNPTYEEAVYLGDLEHAEGFGNIYVKRYIAKPPNLKKIFLNPYLIVSEYKKAFWKQGFIRRMFSTAYPIFNKLFGI